MSTEMTLQSEIIYCYLTSFMYTTECPLKWLSNQKSSAAVSSVLWTQVNVHGDGIAIRNHLLLFHQFYAPKLVSTEMALQPEIICCHLISFTHTSESPPRRHFNHKFSLAISSVLCNFISFSSPLCTQVNVH